MQCNIEYIIQRNVTVKDSDPERQKTKKPNKQKEIQKYNK